MVKSKRYQPHELTAMYTDILGTSIMCKIERCSASEITRMKTPRDEINKGYHRESSTEKETEKLKAVRFIVLDPESDDEERTKAREFLNTMGASYARKCDGKFMPNSVIKALLRILRRCSPELLELLEDDNLI